MENTKLFDYLRESVSPFHTVAAAQKRLDVAGFEQLDYKETWKLQTGGKYYVNQYGSALIAFTMGEDFSDAMPIRMAAAHTDFPGLCIKPNPEISGNCYAQVNVEVYGGAILNTWLDRPLSAAGKVAIKSDQVFAPRVEYIDLKDPIFTIPNLAIHMNREVNKGVELNRQTHMLPLYGVKKEGEELSFTGYLAEKLSCSPQDILDYNLYLYCAEEPQYIGVDQSMISAPRLDNVTSVYAAIESLIEVGDVSGHINVAAIFDHEEIGSKTKQGAASLFFRQVLEKILASFAPAQGHETELLASGMLVSADVAHAVHPNHPEKADLTTKPIMGHGFCIKEACSQSYATDSEVIGIVVQICEQENIPYQKFVNRSDIVGGSTLGSIASTLLPSATVDVGVPILAMHSARECMGSGDEEALHAFVKAFFQL